MYTNKKLHGDRIWLVMEKDISNPYAFRYSIIDAYASRERAYDRMVQETALENKLDPNSKYSYYVKEMELLS